VLNDAIDVNKDIFLGVLTLDEAITVVDREPFDGSTDSTHNDLIRLAQLIASFGFLHFNVGHFAF